MSIIQKVKLTAKSLVVPAAIVTVIGLNQTAAAAASNTIPSLESYAITHPDTFTEIAFVFLLLAGLMLLRRKTID
jgi:hypothetical protein